jgi:acyl carrier protein
MNDVEQQVLAALREQFEREAGLDDTLADLGVDSLGMAELTVEMEKLFDITVDEYILDIETPRELVAYIQKRQAAK